MRRRSDGFMTVTVIVGFMVISLISVAVLGVATSNHQISHRNTKLSEAQLAIDAAISESLVTMNSDSSWVGTGGEIDYHTHDGVRVTYHTAVSNVSPERRKLTVTARVYQPATATTPVETKKAVVELLGTPATSGMPSGFAVLSGSGGIDLIGNSGIVDGPVYSNGPITLSGGSEIGESTNPQKVYNSHQSCGQADGTFPRVCASGEAGQPITLIGGSEIHGEVRATNQTNGSYMFSPGLIAGETAPVATLPDYDRAGQIAAVTTTMTGSAASCASGAKKTWPPNLRVNGNVSVSGNCELTVEGNVWITGSLNVFSGAEMIVAGSATKPPVVMVDGSNGLSLASGTGLVPNASGIGFRMITYYAQGCGACTSVTPSVLAANINRTTILIASRSDVTHAELYARWSRVDIASGSSVGAVVGQRVRISAGSAIPFTRTVSDFVPPASLSGWKVVAYRRDF